MRALHKILSNCHAVTDAEHPSNSFGPTRVQRICNCGYHEATETIKVGLERGFFKRDPSSNYKVMLNR